MLYIITDKYLTQVMQLVNNINKNCISNIYSQWATLLNVMGVAKKFESSLGYPGLYSFFRKEPREETRDNQREMLTDQYMQSMMIALPIRKKKKSLLADGRKTTQLESQNVTSIESTDTFSFLGWKSETNIFPVNFIWMYRLWLFCQSQHFTCYLNFIDFLILL